MNKFLFGLVVALLLATSSLAAAEIAVAANSEIFIKCFGFGSILLVDVYLAIEILKRNTKK